MTWLIRLRYTKSYRTEYVWNTLKNTQTPDAILTSRYTDDLVLITELNIALKSLAYSAIF